MDNLSEEELRYRLLKCQADAALVIHCLDRSLQLIDALISFLPEGTPLHPDVDRCKAALDTAMTKIHMVRKPVPGPPK